MTVSARLLVERGTLRDRSEDWGELAFLGLPSPGDRIAVEQEGKLNYLTVICVHHRPARPGGEEAVSAEVVAKWTGAA